jgi:hypothetical protein
MKKRSVRGDTVCKGERLYYLADSRSIVGNCMQFWRKGGSGYTYNLDDCQLYTHKEAFDHHASRNSDVPYPKDVIDMLAERHIDHQDIDYYEETLREKIATQNTIEGVAVQQATAAL